MDEYNSSLAGQRLMRIDKLRQLKDLGINPFPSKGERTHTAGELLQNFNELENKPAKLCGRIRSIRLHGKIIFMDLEDDTGKIQLYIKEDSFLEFDQAQQRLGWEHLQLIDTGDFIQAEGEITKTSSGEISLLTKSICLLTKAIRPLPTELEDKEERYRRRYLDMILHPEIRDRFRRRSEFWRYTREFLDSKGFWEINTPVLEHVTGGADAKPFTTYYDALGQDFYLRISQELPLKRLLGAGFEKVYDIGPRFRNEGFSDEHLPEHIAMEWYWAYADHHQGMELTQELFRFVLHKVYQTLKFEIRGFSVDLNKDWEKIDYLAIIKERFGVDALHHSVDDMNRILQEHGVELGENLNRNRVVDNLWKLIRKTIGGPAFLVGIPAEFSPLAKLDPHTPEITQRFHPIIAGSELANAYSELNDPLDQLNRFLEQQSMRDSGDDEAQMLDIDFVEMLEYGMPPACGFGFSERVFWFFEGVTAKEGVPFPQLRNSYDDISREIYPSVTSEVKRSPEVSKSVAINISRAQASEFLRKYVKNEYQLHHAEMVATAMEALAQMIGGEDVEKYYITGLIHDWDFDRWPNEHPGRFDQLREELGVDSEMIEAIKGHADLEHPRATKLQQALLALDELSGLMYAYMKMVGKYGDMKTSSIQKKLYKEKAFAAKIDRQYILRGISELGIPEEDLINTVRDAFAAKYDTPSE